MCFNEAFAKLQILKYFSDDFVFLIIWNKIFIAMLFKFYLEYAIRKI
jgi:hypothetical protein